jgi:hypothetical protein
MPLANRQKKYLSRLAAVGLLSGALFVIGRVLFVPLVDAALAHGAEMNQLQARLELANGYAARLPALKQRLAELFSVPDREDGLWPPTSDSVVSASIQSTARQILQSAGATLTRLDAIPVQRASDFRRFGVSAGFSGSDKTLVDVLASLARQRPYLKIENLTIKANEVNNTTDPNNPSFAVLLIVELELSALAQSDQGLGGKK